MRHRAVVYFHGPMTEWSGRPHPEEYVAEFLSRWDWLAHARARSCFQALNSGHCGYFVDAYLEGDWVTRIKVDAPVHYVGGVA